MGVKLDIPGGKEAESVWEQGVEENTYLDLVGTR